MLIYRRILIGLIRIYRSMTKPKITKTRCTFIWSLVKNSALYTIKYDYSTFSMKKRISIYTVTSAAQFQKMQSPCLKWYSRLIRRFRPSRRTTRSVGWSSPKPWKHFLILCKYSFPMFITSVICIGSKARNNWIINSTLTSKISKICSRNTRRTWRRS